MSADQGTCPGCGATGAIGERCVLPVCSHRHLHIIPDDCVEQTGPGKAQSHVGQVLEDFLLVKLVSVSDSSTIYQALQYPFMEPVALKLLRTDAQDPEGTEARIAAFEKQVAVLSALDHPNAIRMKRDELRGRIPFLVMEYAGEGQSLEQILIRRQGMPLPLPVVRGVLEAVLSVLEAAHARSLVHGAVRPGNVFLPEEGRDPSRLRLMDFGVSHALHDSVPEDVRGDVCLCMAPEQLDGGRPGPWTDLYAVVHMAFELVFGEAPFNGLSAAEIEGQKKDPQYDPMGVLPYAQVSGLPSFVPAFFRRALSVDSARRHGTVPELRDALMWALDAVQKAAESGVLLRGAGPSVAPSLLRADPESTLPDAVEAPTSWGEPAEEAERAQGPREVDLSLAGRRSPRRATLWLVVGALGFALAALVAWFVLSR